MVGVENVGQDFRAILDLSLARYSVEELLYAKTSADIHGIAVGIGGAFRMVARTNLEVRGLFAAVISGTNRATCQLTLPDGSSRTLLYPAGKLLGSALRPGMRIARRIGPRTWASGEGQSQIVLKDELDCLLAGPLGLCPVCQREPLRSPLLLGYTISHYRSAQRCAAIFPVGGMKHSQDDPRRSLRSRSYGTTSSEK